MTCSFAAQIDLGQCLGDSQKILGFASGKEGSEILITPSPSSVYSFCVESKTRSHSWQVPSDVVPLVSPAFWVQKSYRYVALGRNGDVLIHWSRTADRLDTKAKRIELPFRAWRLIRCEGRQGSDCENDVWLVYSNGFSEPVSQIVSGGVSRSRTAEDIRQAGLVHAAGEDGAKGAKRCRNIQDAVVYCGGASGHTVALLVRKTFGVKESYEVMEACFEGDLGASRVQRKSFVALGDVEAEGSEDGGRTSPVIAGAVGGGDEEGSDEGFIDSNEGDNEARNGGSEDEIGSPGSLLASCFHTNVSGPCLLTLWEDKHLRRLRFVPGRHRRPISKMETLMVVDHDFTQRPSLVAIDEERIALHALDKDGEQGTLSVWNLRWGGICEETKNFKMFSQLSDGSRVSGTWRAGAWLAVPVGRTLVALRVSAGRSASLSAVMGHGLNGERGGGAAFAGATYFDLPFSTQDLTHMTDLKWEKSTSVNNFYLPENAGEKAVVKCIREGRVADLISCFSDEKIFLRDSLVISALRFALELPADSETDSNLRQDLLAAVMRVPVTVKYLARKLPALDGNAVVEMLRACLSLTADDKSIWFIGREGKGSEEVRSDVIAVVDWLTALFDAKFGGIMLRRGEGDEKVYPKFREFFKGWGTQVKDLRKWDGSLAEVTRISSELKAMKIQAGTVGTERPRSRRTNYQIRVVSGLW